jgi:uncharacterized protein YecT (DUF1311 family)
MKWIALPCLAIAPIAVALASVGSLSSNPAPQRNELLPVSVSPELQSSPLNASNSSEAITTPEASPDVTPDTMTDSEPSSPVNSESIVQGFDCDNPQYQQAMNECAYLDYQEADEALNETYNRLVETLSASRREKLVAAEQAWIIYRDATCEFERSQYAGGSIEPLIYYSCMEQLTQEQTLRLGRYLQSN